MEVRTTVVLGATTNPKRYAYLAVHRLLAHGHHVLPVGIRKGSVGGIPIAQELPADERVHTVTLYVGPAVQEQWHEGILALSPKRIIFNPGAEHAVFEDRARSLGIEVVEGCTLVMLSTGHY